MSPIQQAQPLPECSNCERPMPRELHTAQDGTCTSCRAAQRRAAALEKRYLW